RCVAESSTQVQVPRGPWHGARYSKNRLQKRNQCGRRWSGAQDARNAARTRQQTKRCRVLPGRLIDGFRRLQQGLDLGRRIWKEAPPNLSQEWLAVGRLLYAGQ